jgi:hypothetical protein
MSKKFSLEVPMDLSDITLRQYQKYLNVIKENEDKEADDFINMKIIEIFCNTSLKEVAEIPLKQFTPILIHLKGLFEGKMPLYRDVTMTDNNGDSVKFGFVPSLDDMSLGEFVDLDNYINDWDNMHKAMSVLYRPITFQKKEKYLIQEYDASDKYYEVMKDMPVNVALGSVVFFYRLGRELSKYMTLSLIQKSKTQQSHIRKALEKSGVGINQFTHLLKGMYRELDKSPNFLSNNALFG